jgi:predicted RNA-binding protein YlxR (DUF448 family)
VRRREPIRTCVGCGERDAQRTLLRVVAVDGALRPDPAHRAGGRGAYLHARRTCWHAFAARRGPVRSLRRSPERAERERLVVALEAAQGTEGTR